MKYIFFLFILVTFFSCDYATLNYDKNQDEIIPPQYWESCTTVSPTSSFKSYLNIYESRIDRPVDNFSNAFCNGIPNSFRTIPLEIDYKEQQGIWTITYFQEVGEDPIYYTLEDGYLYFFTPSEGVDFYNLTLQDAQGLPGSVKVYSSK